MFAKNNRRKLARYGVGSLYVGLHRTMLFGFFSSQVDVTAIDFNATGLAFRHARLLSPGQPVILDLLKDQLMASSVVGIVRYTTRMENHFRCGVAFDFEANDHMRSSQLKDTLKAMERVLHEVVILAID
ncbi:hypothetical protein JYT26_00175 [Beggiatoa alba]|nr:hypothetical protein [Beggiatoa alba]